MPKNKHYFSSDDSTSDCSSRKNYKCSRCSKKRSTYNCSSRNDYDHYRCSKHHPCKSRQCQHDCEHNCECNCESNTKNTRREEKTIVITIN